MLSFGLGAGGNQRDGGNGHNHASDSESSSNATAAAATPTSGRSHGADSVLAASRQSARPTLVASNTSSSIRGRSRSPSGSPGFQRRATASGSGRTGSPNQLPTIPSASNIHGNHADAFESHSNPYSSSPLSNSALYINGGHEAGSKTRTSSLAPTASAPRNIPGQGGPDSVAAGSPREGSRLYERGGTSVSSSFGAGTSTSLFSSSFPSSGGIWSNDPKPVNTNPSMPPSSGTNPARAQLSRHLSLSGTMPRTASGSGPLPSPSRNISVSGWPDSPLSVEEVALAPGGDFRQGRSRTRMFGNSPSGSRGATPSAYPNPTSNESGGKEPLNHVARSLSIASDRAASSGIGAGIAISNMSPFVRDTRGLPPLPIGVPTHTGLGSGDSPATAHPYSSSFSTTQDYLHRGLKSANSDSFGSPLGFHGAERTMPTNHGAVGSGRTASMAAPVSRNRREASWGNARPLREGDEDAFYDTDDDDDDYAPPTRSGATSRRHSVAAFTSSSTLTALTSPPAMRSQIGFQVPGDALTSSNQPSRSAIPSSRKNGTSGGAEFSIGGSSRLDDEDLLAADLKNALHINLEAHAARQRREGEDDHSSSSRPGYDSRSSSMPVQGGLHPDRNAQQHTSPFGSLQLGHLPSGPSASPPAARPPGIGHDRRASASGDPYSPSASAARFLATAHNVQPPPIQPQLSSMSPRPQLFKQHSGISPDMDAGQWPPSGAHAFAQHQQSPNFRSGALPSPDQLRNMGHHGHIPPSAGATGGKTQSQMQHSFMSGPGGPGRALSPASGNLAQGYSSPSALGFLPPFVGFPAAPQMSGPPPPALSTHNASAQPYFVPPIAPQPNLNDLGRGVPLHALPSDGPLYIVEFKAGRTDLFYVEDAQHLSLQKGDLVVVEADRGKDLGKCLTSCTLDEVRDFQMHQVESALGQLAANAGGGATIGGVGTLPPDQQPSAAAIARMTKEIHPKKIYGLASPADVALLAVKAADEQKALNVCRAKVLQHQLPMEVTDAEFQFDRRRLTFFYIADRRIDFRNLVKDLFRLYKTRIWLCAVDNGVIQR